ncbi:MAG: class I SAM-dependent methyltransferase [Chloroflexi bacterium]|nr:class I SAM-dependent methyltransferase [Chloroflexota bacterium]
MDIESLIDNDYMDSVDARLDTQQAYIEYQKQEAHRALAFLSRYFDTSSAHVLELGTGYGGKGITYAAQGMQVTALDVDWQSLELARATAEEHQVCIDFLAGDGTRLPFGECTFDAVLLDSVIEHVSDPAALLRECARIVKNGGIVFVVFPPFYGPLSGHIDDYVMIPWFHLLPHRVVKRYLMSLNQRKGILTSERSYAVYASLNGLTVFHFERYARAAGLKFEYFRVRPFLTHPGMRLTAGFIGALRHPPRMLQVRQVLRRARREFDLGTLLVFFLLSVLAPLVFVPFVQEIAAGGCKAVLKKV